MAFDVSKATVAACMCKKASGSRVECTLKSSLSERADVLDLNEFYNAYCKFSASECIILPALDRRSAGRSHLDTAHYVYSDVGQ